MTPIYKTYEIEVWPYDAERNYEADQFVRFDVGNENYSFLDAGYGARGKANFVAWLRKAADAIEKAELE